jgi:feruloyl esterase
MRAADAKMAPVLNATNPNLKPFQAHGGKLILYHGWSDAAIPPLNAVNYYTSVVSGMSGAENFVRLYMVPGMQHCTGGPGPSLFGQFGIFKASDAEHDVSSALEAWVEKGVEPRQIIATKYLKDNPAGSAEMTRPICPYPQIARYTGTGDPKAAASFACALAERATAP